MTKREDYRGWTIKVPFMPYLIEYVSYRHLPTTLAIERNYSRHTIKRFELDNYWPRFVWKLIREGYTLND